MSLQNQQGLQHDDGGEDNLLGMFGHDHVVCRAILGPPTRNINLDWSLVDILRQSLLLGIALMKFQIQVCEGA